MLEIPLPLSNTIEVFGLVFFFYKGKTYFCSEKNSSLYYTWQIDQELLISKVFWVSSIKKMIKREKCSWRICIWSSFIRLVWRCEWMSTSSSYIGLILNKIQTNNIFVFSISCFTFHQRQGREFHRSLNDQINTSLLPDEPRHCHMQPENKAAPSGARLSDCSSVCHHSSCHCCHVGDDDAWILWPRSRLNEHLQTHVSIDVRMDLGYSVTDAPTCPRHIPVSTMSQPGRGKDEPLFAGRDAGRREGGGRGGGYGSGSRATPSIFGFGSCTCPPIDVYLFMMQ